MVIQRISLVVVSCFPKTKAMTFAISSVYILRYAADLIDGHIHPNEPLVRHLVWALLPEPEGRVNVLQQLHGLRVVDGPTANKNKDDCKFAPRHSY